MTDVERAVSARYSKAATAREGALCCPIDYDTSYLEAIPTEILERDYGCGDPTRHLTPGATVLDLGSGGGKACYIASQIVGREGRVIGVDMNDDMLGLAERHRESVAQRIGWSNVSFRKARIQDLALDYRRVEGYLAENPVVDLPSMERFESWKSDLRRDDPLIADGSIDVVVSNCVLNLVRPEDRRSLFAELERVLRRGGRAVISDIVSDEEIPAHLRQDPELWSGCISGAYREDAFLEAFAEAGFYGIRIVSRDEKPWRTVERIEFRSVTVEAFKGEGYDATDPSVEDCCGPSGC